MSRSFCRLFLISGLSLSVCLTATAAAKAVPSAAKQVIGMYLVGYGSYVHVKSVLPCSPAAKAGIQPGDRILDIDGHSGIQNIARFMQTLAQDTKVVVNVRRHSEQIDVVLTTSTFPSTITAHHNLQLAPSEITQIQSAEALGDKLSHSGDHEGALSAYLRALSIIPVDNGWPVTPDLAPPLRAKVIALVARMPAKPRVPDAAMRDEVDGQMATREAASANDLQSAITQLQEAITIAPWWADGYWNLAAVMERAQRYNQAAQDLQYYLTTKPNASDASNIKLKIYALQYEAKQNAACSGAATPSQ